MKRSPMLLRAIGLVLGATLMGASSGVAEPGSYTIRLRAGAEQPAPSLDAARSYCGSRPGIRSHLLLQTWQDADRADLARRGIRFLQYLPDDTWFVSVPSRLLDNESVASRVRWAEPLRSAFRLHPAVAEWIGSSGSGTEDDGERAIFVRVHADVTNDLDVAAAVGARVLTRSSALHAMVVVVDANGARLLSERDEVRWIRPEHAVPRAANDGNRANTGAGVLQALPYGLTGSGITAAMWDISDIDTGHPDLTGRIQLIDGQGEGIVGGHPTNVAGTLGGDGAASGSNGGLPGQWRGMAPGVSILGYDHFDYDETDPGAGFALESVEQHDDAINVYGATITNNSWSWRVPGGGLTCDAHGDYDWYAPDYDAVSAGLYGDPITIVFAAGNDRDDEECVPQDPGWGTLPPPQTAKNVIAVGSVAAGNDGIAGYSSFGPVDDGRLKPDLVAPGTDISEFDGGDGGVTTPYPPVYGPSYTTVTGTSVAAPTVTGCIALLQEAAVAAIGDVLSPAAVKAIVVQTARDLGGVGPDYAFGFGAIDARAAVDALHAGAYAEGTIETPADVVDVAFEVGATMTTAQATLTWLDPPGAAQSLPALVNDLDLVLVDPMGGIHDPWHPDPSIPGAPSATGTNHRDVIEQVTVEDPAPGTWIARVSATNVPMGPQSFAVSWSRPGPRCTGDVVSVTTTAELLDAIANAADCDTIRLAAGTYDEFTAVIDRDIVFVGEGGADATILEPPFFERHLMVTADPVFIGLTFRLGAAFGSLFDGWGGVAFLDIGTRPTFRDCVFTENISGTTGGAIAGRQSSPRFESCVFAGNVTNGLGGAVCLSYAAGPVRIEECVFAGNTASSAGALYTDAGVLGRIERNTFVGNSASFQAGAAILSAGSSSLLFRANIVARNEAPTASGLMCVGARVENLTRTCNDIWMNDVDGVCPNGSNELAEDPMLCVPEAAFDWAIHPDSPCAAENSPLGCGRIGARDPDSGCVALGVLPSAEAALAFTIGPVTPNPSSGAITALVGMREAAEVEVAVFDAGGRRMRDLGAHTLDIGRHEVHWDGRDDAGAMAPAGVYFLRVMGGVDTVSRKLVLTR